MKKNVSLYHEWSITIIFGWNILESESTQWFLHGTYTVGLNGKKKTTWEYILLQGNKVSLAGWLVRDTTSQDELFKILETFRKLSSCRLNWLRVVHFLNFEMAFLKSWTYFATSSKMIEPTGWCAIAAAQITWIRQ